MVASIERTPGTGIATELFAPALVRTGRFGLIGEPDVDRELEAVSSKVRALIDAGTPPHRIAVVSRDARPYGDFAIRALADAGVPATARRRIGYREIPAVRAVFALLEAGAEGWTRYGLAELGSQPYLAGDIDPRVVNFIGHRDRVAGLDGWTAALGRLLAESRAAEAVLADETERRARTFPSQWIERAAERFQVFTAMATGIEADRPIAGWLEWLAGWLERDPWRLEERIMRVPADRWGRPSSRPSSRQHMHREPGHPVEMALIAGDHAVTARQRRARDQEVRGRDPAPLGAEPGIQLAEHAGDFKRHWHDGDGPQEGLDELLTAGAAGRGVCAPAAVKQLSGAHDRDPQLRIAPVVHQLGNELRGRLALAFSVNENGGINQEPHSGRSSGGSSARMESRSSPNPPLSTTGVRPPRSARHSEARRPATTGGAMAQMSCPRRWIRYRRPLATSSSTFENERLASVAEIRFGRLSDLRAIDLILQQDEAPVNHRCLSWSIGRPVSEGGDSVDGRHGAGGLCAAGGSRAESPLNSGR